MLYSKQDILVDNGKKTLSYFHCELKLLNPNELSCLLLSFTRSSPNCFLLNSFSSSFNIHIYIISNFVHSSHKIFSHLGHLTTWNIVYMWGFLEKLLPVYLPNSIVQKHSTWMLEYQSTLPSRNFHWSHFNRIPFRDWTSCKIFNCRIK